MLLLAGLAGGNDFGRTHVAAVVTAELRREPKQGSHPREDTLGGQKRSAYVAGGRKFLCMRVDRRSEEPMQFGLRHQPGHWVLRFVSVTLAKMSRNSENSNTAMAWK